MTFMYALEIPGTLPHSTPRSELQQKARLSSTDPLYPSKIVRLCLSLRSLGYTGLQYLHGSPREFRGIESSPAIDLSFIMWYEGFLNEIWILKESVHGHHRSNTDTEEHKGV